MHCLQTRILSLPFVVRWTLVKPSSLHQRHNWPWFKRGITFGLVGTSSAGCSLRPTALNPSSNTFVQYLLWLWPDVDNAGCILQYFNTYIWLKRIKKSYNHLPVLSQNLEVLQGNMSLTCILPLTKVVISSSLSKMDRVCSKLFSSHSQCFVISLRDDPDGRGERWCQEQNKKKLEQGLFSSKFLNYSLNPTEFCHF